MRESVEHPGRSSRGEDTGPGQRHQGRQRLHRQARVCAALAQRGVCQGGFDSHLLSTLPKSPKEMAEAKTQMQAVEVV